MPHRPGDSPHYPWRRLGMPETEWSLLADAFYDCAHNDPHKLHMLPAHLRDSAIGRLCAGYIESGNHELLEQAWLDLTGSKEWYVYLGR